MAPVIQLDMYQTAALAVVSLLLGDQVRKRVKPLLRFCIPAPVVGGLLFAILSYLLYLCGVAQFAFDNTIQEICMILFFTSVGFQADISLLKKGGKSLVLLVLGITGLIILQNATALGLASLLKLPPLTGLCTGSIPMIGGHGTAGAFGPLLEEEGVQGATVLCTAAATFGLIAGCLMGGPLGASLIKKKGLAQNLTAGQPPLSHPRESETPAYGTLFAQAVFQLAIAIGIGTIFSRLLKMTGLALPVQIGAMLAAALMRNLANINKKVQIHLAEMNQLSGIFLSLFLGIAMITLRLWEIADLALPLVLLLAGQTIMMFLFARFVMFNLLGRDYDAAVMTAGVCGFGMGATPNAMANMQVLCDKYIFSPKAFLLIPLVGALLNDFINSLALTVLINILK